MFHTIMYMYSHCSRESASSSTEDTMSPIPPLKKCKLHTTSTDHNYSKVKNSTDSSDNSMELGKDSVAPISQNLSVTDSSQATGSLPAPSTNSWLSVPSSNSDLKKGEATDGLTMKRPMNNGGKAFEHISDSSLMKDLAVSDSSQSQSATHGELPPLPSERESAKDMSAEKTPKPMQQKLKLSPFSMASILGENNDDSKRNSDFKCKVDLSERAEFQNQGSVDVKECADESLGESASPIKVSDISREEATTPTKIADVTHEELVSPTKAVDISVFSGMDENSTMDDELEKLCRSVAEGEDEDQFPKALEEKNRSPKDTSIPDEPTSFSTPKKCSASPMEEESCGEVFLPSKTEVVSEVPMGQCSASVDPDPCKW